MKNRLRGLETMRLESRSFSTIKDHLEPQEILIGVSDEALNNIYKRKDTEKVLTHNHISIFIG